MHSVRKERKKKRTNTDSAVISESELGPEGRHELDPMAQTEIIILIILASLAALTVDKTDGQRRVDQARSYAFMKFVSEM